MTDIFLETLYDNLKLFPFLFAAYFFLEWLERKTSEKTVVLIKKSEKSGVFLGALLGALPQCGFSAVAANFYAVRIITLGTLAAVFLSCSDEMLPLLLTNGVPLKTVLALQSYKFCWALLCGLALDWCLRHTPQLNKPDIETMCRNEGCHCEKNILLPALRHSLNVALFVFLITLLLNFTEAFASAEFFAGFLQKPLTAELLGGLIGLIPNCSASALLTQLYLNGYIGAGALLSGSLSGGGVGLLVLFRINRHPLQNLKITALLYFCGVLGGLAANLFDLMF